MGGSGSSIDSKQNTLKTDEFEEKHKNIIRGILYEIEEKNDSKNKAIAISDALFDAFQEYWSIAVYSSCQKEKGYGPFFHWRNKLRVYGVLYRGNGSPYSENGEMIEEFIKTEFGWGIIQDFDKVQQLAEVKVNEKFTGNWKVHVVKAPDDWVSYIYGKRVQFGDIWFLIMKVSD
jgi:hypothetical protein